MSTQLIISLSAWISSLFPGEIFTLSLSFLHFIEATFPYTINANLENMQQMVCVCVGGRVLSGKQQPFDSIMTLVYIFSKSLIRQVLNLH